jgi:DNA mismatch repair protein MutS2
MEGRLFSEELLEYPALKELLGRHVASDAGRRRLAAMQPTSDREALVEALAETRESIAYLQAASQPKPAGRGAALRPRFDNLPDLAPHLEKLRIEGAVLEPQEILDALHLLDRASDLRAVLTASGGRFPRLAERAFRIGEFRELLRDLSGRILPDGGIADNASVALQRIRRDIERQQKQVHESLERFLRAHRDDGVLQEDFITIRNDRFVVPVVTGQKRKVDGVIHAASGTGHTLFIEPFETIELNNDLVRLREEEQREVLRILREMSDRLRAVRAEIEVTAEEMAALEWAFAKATFAQEFRCTVPRFSDSEKPRLALEAARHPLLEDVLRKQRKEVVPISLTLEGSTHMLLISGPNTGGKTVALKTVGLLALMAQSGLPVPAERAELPLFENVLADLGDHQSIEQSLSSFSAHVARIGEMLSNVTSDSLVLLDELGRATDPDEGGALAVAILDRLRAWDAFLLASTHLMAPKVYGATTEGVLNASMSFDEATLAPTYVLRTGAPGASAGLQIAERLGLPKAVIEQARSKLTTQQQDLSRLVQLLEEKLEAARRLEQELQARRDALAVEQAQLSKTWEKREAKKLEELESRSEAVFEEFRKRAGQTIEQIQQSADQRKLAEKGQRRISQLHRELQEQVALTLKGAPPATEKSAPAVREGARVRLHGVSQPARVRKLLGQDRIEVDAGLMRMQVHLSEVTEVLPDAPQKSSLPGNVTFRGAGAPAQREVNVIGQHVEEAREAVDRFLDQAALASLESVRIVHGHGMGVLKRAIAEMLSTHPLVAGFREASQPEGGAGATIVEMRT